MPYTHFRYIAYQVPTVGIDVTGNFLEMPKGDSDLNNMLILAGNKPVINNLTNDDAKRRVARFYMAMIDASNYLRRSYVADDKYTLKIFMAPEFYFRPTTADGTEGPAYSVQEYREIKAALRKLANDSRFNNWLIIPGTIMWVGTGQIGKRPATVDNVYFNSCPYIKVGEWASPQFHVLEKEKSSCIDGLPTGRHGVPAVMGYRAAKATDEVWTRYQTKAKKQKHVFEHYGTQCGVEICLEHGCGLLKDILSDLADGKVGSILKSCQSISLQLLTAGGMPIKNDQVAVTNNGYILRNDGFGSNGLPQVEIKRVTHYLNNIFGNALSVSYGHKPSFAQYDVAAIPLEYTIPLVGPQAVPAPAGYNPAFYFQQEIKFYTRCKLP